MKPNNKMIQSLFSLKISWSWAAHREAEKEATTHHKRNHLCLLCQFTSVCPSEHQNSKRTIQEQGQEPALEGRQTGRRQGDFTQQYWLELNFSGPRFGFWDRNTSILFNYSSIGFLHTEAGWNVNKWLCIKFTAAGSVAQTLPVCLKIKNPLEKKNKTTQAALTLKVGKNLMLSKISPVKHIYQQRWEKK